MNDPYTMILRNAAQQNVFPPNSRYRGLPTATLTKPDGTVITYVRRRFVPPPERFATLTEHSVVEGDRMDSIAAKYLGDPEQFWRLCDANGAMRPAELEVVGGTVRVTLPEGIPAPSHA